MHYICIFLCIDSHGRSVCITWDWCNSSHWALHVLFRSQTVHRKIKLFLRTNKMMMKWWKRQWRQRIVRHLKSLLTALIPLCDEISSFTYLLTYLPTSDKPRFSVSCNVFISILSSRFVFLVCLVCYHVTRILFFFSCLLFYCVLSCLFSAALAWNKYRIYV